MTTIDADVFDPAGLTGAWTLDVEKTSIAIQTKAVWLLAVRGTAKALDGGGTVAADGVISGSLVVDATSIDTGNAKRDAHLRTADFFEIENHPTITYTATGGSIAPSGQVELTGTLTMRGQSRPLTLTGRVEVVGDSATLSAQAEIDRAQWGLTWAKLGAGLMNRLVISAHFDKI